MNYILWSLLLIFAGYLPGLAQPVIWTSQSKNSSESMPCGGGDIGLNVWVENGDVLFYLSRSGTFDENNAMLKLGRVRLKLSPNPFNGTDFKQELKLTEGGITISGGNTQVNLWVDVFRSVVHVALQSAKPVSITAAYESWRYEDHVVQGTEFRTNSYKAPQKFDVITRKDAIAFQGNDVLFYHRNRNDIESIFDYTVRLEGMDSVKGKLFNPLINNTFGGLMRGHGMKPVGIDTGTYAHAPFRAWMIATAKPVRSQEIEIGLNVAQTTTLDEWKAGLTRIMNEADRAKKTAQQTSRDWWLQFWNRSYISIDSKDTAVAAISRNYQLFRYQLGCNAYGKWPTKFNGGLFTFDPEYVDAKYAYSPDFRLWGGGTMTAQNQRLVYHPMLKSGDFDMLKSQFDFYLRNQTNAELRSQVYWQHNGACFTEQIENFGLPNITEYGTKRPDGYDPGMEYNAWLEYEWDTVFEFCLMMLETERYEGRDIAEYVPFIESCLTFYDEHYQQLAKKRGIRPFDAQGHYILYPSSACETYKMTYNSATVISALKVILGRMLELPDKYLDTKQREKWGTMLKRIPPLPFQDYDGHKTLAPAVAWARIQNSESPQLYPVYPWGIYGLEKPDLDIAINTWNYDTLVVKYRSHVGWRQHNIFAARLGLTEEAASLTKLKFKNSSHRFPTFWGPGFDWTPDHNWGGSAMIGLQEMLMQTDGKTIRLLPAWPKDWNVTFKLHAPYNTIVEGRVVNGKVEKLTVTPQERAKDVILPK
ncbi:hypothetical protein EXU85_21535 [Spirosoma sp. KCTC 42546]|uniref:DUF5703 domain-containing protein n=1 Tax=Spirosoma sp. KCTC 42546 TaxID=2520506 RepID=UPI00115A9632|nr:DUF5703 domain-containing protein [Spirosoma sp. KCTC 42546]QDK81053.1 hypothetical protein EXU85_21535 [Spirosoma sp. KCTC 42546]